MSQTLLGRRYDNGKPVEIGWDNARITSMRELAPEETPENLPYVSPGLFDIQINGYCGIWFSKVGLTSEEVGNVLKQYLPAGVTQMFPTLVTNSFDALASGFAAIKKACEEHDWIDRMIPGCHLEGPYLSSEDGPRGAHPLQHIRAADWQEFCELQEISGNRIKLLTVAPEQEGVLEFIPKAVESGVVISIGHTGASPEQIQAAADAGARMSTHFGNGAHGMLRRHPNYLWEQLADDRLVGCLITDGHHVPASLVKSVLRVKSLNNALITCDASGMAGLPVGTYEDGNMHVEILEDGRIVIAGQRQLLAGSGATTVQCVAEAMKMVDLTLADAINLTSRNPGRFLNVETGDLKLGGLADMILFDFAGIGQPIKIKSTIVKGCVEYGTID